MQEGDIGTIALRLGLATLVGLVLGFEREWRGHDAGLKTHALVALSSAMITVSALMMSDDLLRRGSDSDPVRVVQGLAQAIGFIAGGLIFVRGGDVRNMTTAASLWMAAGVGIAAGAGQFTLLAVASRLAIAVMTSLAIVQRWMPERQERSDKGDRVAMPSRRGSSPDVNDGRE